MSYQSCDMEEFIKKHRNKKILCFGGGSYFRVLFYDFKQRDSGIGIEGIIDNNPQKNGISLEMEGQSFPIYSLESAERLFDMEQTPILITSASHGAILKQLEEKSYFQRNHIYSYFDLKKNSTPSYNVLDMSTDKPVIPKKIHYCWFGGNPIPEKLRICMDTWKRFCPDYEIYEWNEHNYDVNKNYFMRTAYINHQWAFVPDYARVDIIYEHGGIYLDTDVELIKSMDELTCNQAFFCAEVSGGINTGLGFGAAPGNRLVGELKRVYEAIGHLSPFFFNTCIGREIGTFSQFGYENSGRYQALEEGVIYPFQVMAAKIKETGEDCRSGATIGIHQFNGSWQKERP